MKNPFSIAILFSVLGHSLACAEVPGFKEHSPFKSVNLIDGSIVVEFPDKPGYLLSGKGETLAKRPRAKPGQLMRLVPGSKMQMTPDRHISYEVDARLEPQPGVQTVYMFDARSFGRELMKHEYFVPATVVDEPAKDGQADEEPADGRIFHEKFIIAWGYRTTWNETVEQSEWEVEHFGKARVRQQSIKAVEPLKGEERMFPRFEITEETFATEAEANGRIEKIRDTPPGVNTKLHPHWVLREGVASGKRAYIVSTDSVMFRMEALPGLMKLVRKRLGVE